MNKLLLKIRFFIKVTLLRLPFLSKKERLDIYEKALVQVEEVIYREWWVHYGLCWIFQKIYKEDLDSPYGHLIECYEMELHFPEVYKLYKSSTSFKEGRIYWYPTDKEGYIQRKELLEKAISKLKK